jgi:hypothetical protein
VLALLKKGEEKLGRSDYQGGYAVKKESWRRLHESMPNLGLRATGRERNSDDLLMSGPYSEFVRAFSFASKKLFGLLPPAVRVPAISRFFIEEVPTYGVYLPPNATAERGLRRAVTAWGLPPQMTLTGAPRVLFCLGAQQRFEQRIAEGKLSVRPEASRAFQRCVLVHEHFHALIATAPGEGCEVPLALRSPDAWAAAAPVDEALAAWMELHLARETGDDDLRALVMDFIRAGSYPHWPYAMAVQVERLFEEGGLSAVRDLVRALRRDPVTTRLRLESDRERRRRSSTASWGIDPGLGEGS